MDMLASPLCHHCGELVPPSRLSASANAIAGDARQFCCSGCEAAAAWIGDAALDDYYRLRSANAGRVGTDALDFSAWDRDVVLAEHSREIDGVRETTVLTDAMRCAACAWLIDRALRLEPGVLDAGANAITGRITVRWDPQRTQLSTLMSRLAALGYRPWLATGEAREREQRREWRRWLLRLGIAGLGAMQTMMFAEALFLDTHGQMAVATRDFFRWVTFLVCTPVVFYSGWPFIEGMARELRGRRVGMDTLIAGSTLLAYVASVIETLRGGPQVWYDAAAMFVLLLLLARTLEQRARRVASAQVDAMARARPALATRELADGIGEQVPLAELRVDDIVRVAAGEAVPADGTLLDLASDFNEALISGESAAVRRNPGETALAGSVCQERPARLRITRTGSDTRLSQLTRLVEQAQGERPRLSRIADRVASAFVFALLPCAIAVYAWWRQHDPSRAFEITLSVLVVSCPCALSLAIPAALTSAHGALARLGVLGLRPDALMTLARVDHVMFDKTGTLSTGTPQLASVDAFEGFAREEVLRIAAALERDIRHPLAAALATQVTSYVATDMCAVPGLGLEAFIDGRPWRIGRADFAAAGIDDGALWLGDGTRAIARFEIEESCRPDANVAIAALRRLRLGVELCSGDAGDAVARFASLVGVKEFRARQKPEQKLARVRELQAQGRVVAMIGDGLNDAPVLAGADVSLAMADGAALAQRAADFVITSPSLLRIPQAIATARRARRIIRQNLAWALAYNLAALPLAATGHVTPWLAALGMALSSLLVTLNALRLTRIGS
jgi:Cu2+-exporting ATPase